MNFHCHAFKSHLWTTNDAWIIRFSSIVVTRCFRGCLFFLLFEACQLETFRSCSDFSGKRGWKLVGFKVDLVIDGILGKWDVYFSCFYYFRSYRENGYSETLNFVENREILQHLRSLINDHDRLLYFWSRNFSFDFSFHSMISVYFA